jgi:hypothetical protein
MVGCKQVKNKNNNKNLQIYKRLKWNNNNKNNKNWWIEKRGGWRERKRV